MKKPRVVISEKHEKDSRRKRTDCVLQEISQESGDKSERYWRMQGICLAPVTQQRRQQDRSTDRQSLLFTTRKRGDIMLDEMIESINDELIYLIENAKHNDQKSVTAYYTTPGGHVIEIDVGDEDECDSVVVIDKEYQNIQDYILSKTILWRDVETDEERDYRCWLNAQYDHFEDKRTA